MMNEKEVWLEIEKAYDTQSANRTDEQCYITRWGICFAIKKVVRDRNLRKIMCHKIWDDMPSHKKYFCSWGKAGDAFRAEYCRKQASLL